MKYPRLADNDRNFGPFTFATVERAKWCRIILSHPKPDEEARAMAHKLGVPPKMDPKEQLSLPL